MILEAFQLHGKNALVTGSRTGIGAAIAVGLAQAGANVAVHGSKQPGLEEVAARVRAAGGRAAAIAVNLADPRGCDELFERAVQALGSVDILVNNAGIIRRAPATEYSMEDWRAILDLNLDAVFRLSQLAGRAMLARGQGKIINIASVLSFQGGIRVPAYAAAKGGLVQLTKALANEWAPSGVNVNAIAPGYIETDATAALKDDPERNRQIVERIPAGRWGVPADLVAASVFLASPASDYVHGHVLVVDGGWLAR